MKFEKPFEIQQYCFKILLLFPLKKGGGPSTLEQIWISFTWNAKFYFQLIAWNLQNTMFKRNIILLYLPLNCTILNPLHPKIFYKVFYLTGWLSEYKIYNLTPTTNVKMRLPHDTMHLVKPFSIMHRKSTHFDTSADNIFWKNDII